MTTIFHFFFVPFFDRNWCRCCNHGDTLCDQKDEKYRRMTKFWGNIFLLSFVVGVVTGIIQEFQFGMNWSDYSRLLGIFLVLLWR